MLYFTKTQIIFVSDQILQYQIWMDEPLKWDKVEALLKNRTAAHP